MQVTIWPRGMNRTITSGPSGIDWGIEPAVTVPPVHLSDTGQVKSIKFSTRYGHGFGGFDLFEVVLHPFGGYVGGLFRPGDHVRVTTGGSTVYEGMFSEAVQNPDDTITLKARGYGYALYDYDSIYFDPGPTPDVSFPTNRLASTSPPVAPSPGAHSYGYEYAVFSLGMPISQVVGAFPTTAWGLDEMAGKPVKVGEVLTALLLELNKRWAVWGRTLVIAADTTTAAYRFDSPQGLVGVADTEYATHVGVWYISDVGPPVLTTIEWAIDTVGVTRFDVRTVVVDYRGAGLMSGVARAQPTAQSLLDQVKGRSTLAGSITLTKDSGFSEINGGAAILSAVRAGQGMELNNVRTSQGNLLPDGNFAIIGQTDYQWTAPLTLGGKESETLTITPMGAVPRNLGEILQGVPGDFGERLGGVT